MGQYLKLFDTHAEYMAFTQTADFLLPNVSHCVEENDVHYNPYVKEETRVIATYSVEDDTNPTQLGYNNMGSLFDKIEIDGTEVSIADIQAAEGAYQLSVGEHTVAYTLKDPTSIAGHTFSTCVDMTNVTIPNSITTIDSYAFWGCSNLTSVTIGSSVTTLGYEVFGACNLNSITSLAMTPPTIKSDTFRDAQNNGTLYVPQGSGDEYEDEWMKTGNYYLGKYGWTVIEQ